MSTNDSHILVVDDIEDNRYTLERRLKRDGYSNINLVDGGQAALDIISQEKFDLILLDLMMPDISGLDVLQSIKTDPINRHIPIIMVTAADEIETAAECIKNGADDYITKPFNATLLRARVTASLEKKKLRDRESAYLNRIESDKQRSQELLRAVVPPSVASELKSAGQVRPRKFDDVAILICDLVGFTKFCGQNPPEYVIQALQEVFETFEGVFNDFGLEKIKTVGDAILAVSGMSNDNIENPVTQTTQCALELRRVANESELSWGVHVGIHFGTVIAGVVGKQTMQFDILGDTVNLAFNICDLSKENQVLISNDAWMLARNQIKVKSVGIREMKNRNDMEIFECISVI